MNIMQAALQKAGLITDVDVIRVGQQVTKDCNTAKRLLAQAKQAQRDWLKAKHLYRAAVKNSEAAIAKSERQSSRRDYWVSVLMAHLDKIRETKVELEARETEYRRFGQALNDLADRM